ncbi:carbon-phosphorus lyase complex subunit [Rhodospirillaceae bacterium LM-1]|nr:carbon-phosphorus lyase complex subunit [Rhodospirillaceae bacterium LM-1]
MSEQILANAKLVLKDRVVEGHVLVRSGRIEDIAEGRQIPVGAQDMGGDYLLPGFIELHTDNMEKHFNPRPGVMWPSSLAAILAHDIQIAGAGITTVLDAICVGEYNANQMRRHILVESIAAVKEAAGHNLLRAEHLFHMRCEVSDEGVEDMFRPYADEPLVHLVSLMDHTPGQRQWRNMEAFKKFYKLEKLSEEELEVEMAGRISAQKQFAEKHRKAILDLARPLNLPLASHDDTTVEHVVEGHADGVTISEFPTTLEAARAARSAGMGIVMGAPNVVRGGSHSGNVSALELAKEGLLDALSSDYMPTSLLQAVFVLHESVGLPLSNAVATVSANPAAMLRMKDRGEIAVGKRADLIQVRKAGATPVVRQVWREGQRVL